MGDFFGSYVGRFVAMFLFFLVPVTVISYVALYFYMVPIIERDGQAQIAEELVQLGEELDSGGLEGLTQTINRRIRQSINDRTVYLLEGPDGQFLAGNVSNDPELYSIGPGIVTLNVIPNGLATPNEYIARAVHLRGGYTLMIGKQTDARHAFQNIIVLGIAVSIALALVVGLIWQAAFEGQMRRRVAEIGRTATEIVRGDLTKRFEAGDGRDEFDELARAVNGMIDQIENLVGQLRAVTDAIAHDFRSPLARVKSGLESASGNDATIESLRRSHDSAQKEIDRMLTTLNSLLEISRVEAGIGREQMTEVDLGTVIHDVGGFYQPLAEEKGVTIVTHADRMIPVLAHKVLLTQAIINLVDNAVKFSPAGETVTLEATTGPGYPSIIVGDHGPGIPADEISKITTRFVRLDPARPKGGSGLGLSLVAAVAKFHGATLEFRDNHPGLKVVLRFVTPAKSRLRSGS